MDKPCETNTTPTGIRYGQVFANPEASKISVDFFQFYKSRSTGLFPTEKM